MGRGRRNRRPGGGGGGFASGGTGGGGVSQLPALPSTAVAAWHSEITCTAASWTDYIGGRVLAAIGTPTVGADVGFFNGKTVAKSVSTGSYWRGIGLAGLPLAGTRPWLFVVARLRDLTIPSAEGFAGFTSVSNGQVESGMGATAASWLAGFSGVNQTTGTPDTSVHRFKGWRDGTNRNIKLDNNAAVSTADAASTVTTITEARIGGYANPSNDFPSDGSIAYVLLCSAQPTAPEEAALDAWAQAYWFPPQTPPLPASAVAAWHSEINCSAASWTDYIGGRVLAGIGTPVVATDGAFFNGRVVAQAARTGAKTWANRTLPTVVASGTRPWLYGVWRLRATGVIQMMFGFGAATHDYQSVYAETTPRVTGYINDGALGIPGPLADLAVHRHKLWLDGTNGNLTVDNTNFPVATAATIGGAVTAIALGAAAGSDINQCDVSIAFFLVCSAQPTAPEIAALDAWAQAYFGAP